MSEHHPNCYQRTGVPDEHAPGLCDCRVLRMLDGGEADTHRECGRNWVDHDDDGVQMLCPEPTPHAVMQDLIAEGRRRGARLRAEREDKA